MAGGLFGKPFALNEKCIVFSIIIMALFLYKPNIKSNLVLGAVLFGIFVVSYVAMAWYDYYFDCKVLPLKRGEVGGVTSLFKPDAHEKKQETHEETSLDHSRKMIFVYISHILLVAPLLLYIARYRSKVNPMTYPILVVLAAMTALYHGIHLLSMSH